MTVSEQSEEAGHIVEPAPLQFCWRKERDEAGNAAYRVSTTRGDVLIQRAQFSSGDWGFSVHCPGEEVEDFRQFRSAKRYVELHHLPAPLTAVRAQQRPWQADQEHGGGRRLRTPAGLVRVYALGRLWGVFLEETWLTSRETRDGAKRYAEERFFPPVDGPTPATEEA